MACPKLTGKSASMDVASSLRHTPKYLGLVNNLTQAHAPIICKMVAHVTAMELQGD